MSRPPRVVTLTLNPAIDVTYRAGDWRPGQTVRVGAPRSRAGGKGINVAAVVGALGGRATALALGDAGVLRDALDDLGLDHRLVPALDGVRRTVAVVSDDGVTTIFQEPGPPARAGTAEAITTALEEELDDAGVVVVSGSVPPGLPPELPAGLAERCRARGVPVVLDVAGDALRSAVGTGATLVPNTDELAELTGAAPASDAELVDLGQGLLAAGTDAVVVTGGDAGAVAITRDGAWRARPAEVVVGNPTGAGDAAAAALARHLARGGLDWPAALADMVATSAAAVCRPVAGEIDSAARERWLAGVSLTEVGPTTVTEGWRR